MNFKSLLLTITSLAASTSAMASASASPLTLAFQAEMPTIDSSFSRWDICQEVDDLIDSLGFAANLLPRLCNHEMTQSFSVGVAAVSLAGTLEELVVQDGEVHVDGGVDISVQFTPLRIAGGRAPVFAPCDRGDFMGCSEPTLATFANLLASYVPAIEVDVPLPVRVCVPGSPIVVEPMRIVPGRWIPGYWSGWTWHRPRYIAGSITPPVVELCHIADYGELPTVTFPEVEEVVVDIFPHVRADMGIRVAGNGSIEIEIPVPYAGAKFGYGNSWMDLNLSAGVSLVLSMEVANAGADAFLSFDQQLHVHSRFVKGQGWTQSAELLANTLAPALVPDRPDVTIRAGVKLGVDATAMVHVNASDESSASASADEPVQEVVVEDDAEASEEGDSLTLPPLPVEEPVQCAAQWLVGGAALELGMETKAEFNLFVEGSYSETGFAVAAAGEFAHAESLSAPGLCAMDCATLAGEDNPACDTIELFRAPVL